MLILLGKHTLDYMVRVEGSSIDFSPAPKAPRPTMTKGVFVRCVCGDLYQLLFTNRPKC